MKYRINTTEPDNKLIMKVKAGDMLYLSGEIYTARDQAHLRLYKAIKAGAKLPLELKNKVIYYCGPTAKKKNTVIGSCGPTTSSRMDLYTPALLSKGIKMLIGKGKRNDEVRKAIKKYNALYLIAPAGCGAYISTKVVNAQAVAYKELKAEAIRKLEIEDFPAIVCIDAKGRYLY
jgi:fumarate hydratase subunit beta